MESQRNLRDRNYRMDCTSKKILIFSEMVDVRKKFKRANLSSEPYLQRR